MGKRLDQNNAILGDVYSKTSVTLDEKDIKLSMPFVKVNIEQRLVHGFATLDNLDEQDDIVVKDSSVKAFERFRGNLREQHDDTKAVGRVVDFKSDEYFDSKSGNTYDGIFVTTYISKGAEDTWQKVLDGTLSGFSIAGAIHNFDHAVAGDTEKPIRIITDYDLTELSLVDSPANELANVVSIQKMDDGSTKIFTPLSEGEVDNIFYCETDGLTVIKNSDDHICSVCGSLTKSIGIIEADDPDKDAIIKTSLESFKSKNTNKKEDNKVAEDVVEKTDSADPLPDVIDSEMEKSNEVEEEIVEKSDTVEKSETIDEEIVEKSETPEAANITAADKVDDLSTLLTASLTKLADAIAGINEQLDTLTKSVVAVEGNVDGVQGQFDEFGKRVDAVEDTTAFRKSGDIGDVVQEEAPVERQASPWGGRFLNSADL